MFRINPNSMCFISMLSTIPGMTLEKCTQLSQRYSSMNDLCATFTEERPKSPSSPSSTSFRNSLPKISSLEKEINSSNHIQKKNTRRSNIHKDKSYLTVKHHLTSDSLHYITMLCQIPGIDLRKASLVSEYFPTMSELCFGFRKTSSPYLLKEIINPSLSATIYEFLLSKKENCVNQSTVENKL